MTGRPARAPGVPEPGAPPARSQARPPGDDLPVLPAVLRPEASARPPRGPHPAAPWAPGWDGLGGSRLASRTSLPEPRTTRKAWVSHVAVASSVVSVPFFFFGFVLPCFFFFFLLEKNKTFQDKVHKNFF